jgi:hypothetical protein
MNEHPDDTTLTRELRDSVSQLTVTDRPPLAAITGRGRARQRRRLATFAGVGGAGVAAGTALALGLTGALSTTPALRTGTGTGTTASPAVNSTSTIVSRPAHSTGTIQTAAFTLTSNANGTDTLTLTRAQVFDPAVFEQALKQHGIPALVQSGSYCVSSPAPPNPAVIGVLSIQVPGNHSGLPRAVPVTSATPPSDQILDNIKWVINPAAIPAGTELYFGYSDTGRALFFDLIDTSSYTCSGSVPPMTPV